MNKGTSTEYTAVPATVLSSIVVTERYQPASTASSSHPLPHPLSQTTSQSTPHPYDPRTTHNQQQQTNTVVKSTAQSDIHISLEIERPRNYLVLSLINLLCCCLPLGILALVYSLKVDSQFDAGRFEDARRAAESAKSVNYVGLVIGVSIYLTLIIIAGIYVIAAVELASGEQ